MFYNFFPFFIQQCSKRLEITVIFFFFFSLRRPEDLHPEQYQQQLDQLIAEYAQLQERTEAIESVNREGGKFIREAKVHIDFSTLTLVTLTFSHLLKLKKKGTMCEVCVPVIKGFLLDAALKN